MSEDNFCYMIFLMLMLFTSSGLEEIFLIYLLQWVEDMEPILLLLMIVQCVIWLQCTATILLSFHQTLMLTLVFFVYMHRRVCDLVHSVLLCLRPRRGGSIINCPRLSVRLSVPCLDLTFPYMIEFGVIGFFKRNDSFINSITGNQRSEMDVESETYVRTHRHRGSNCTVLSKFVQWLKMSVICSHQMPYFFY